MTVLCLYNSIFVGTKTAMLSSRQVFTKSVITWATVISWLEPKTHSKVQVYAMINMFVWLLHAYLIGSLQV